MFRALAIVGRGLLATTLISLLAVAAGLIWLRASGQSLLAVQSGSMRPVFAPGDAVLVDRHPTNLRLGQVISFHQAGTVVSHRIIGRTHGRWITAGDAQPQVHQVVATDQIIGRVTSVAPGVGHVLDAFHQPIGLIGMVYLPATMLVVSELLRLRRRLATPRYQLFPSQ